MILGSTPEFRDWGYEENLKIHVVDKSQEYYEQISREIRHKNLIETVHFSEWEKMHFSETFDIIIGDLSIGNINKNQFIIFLQKISDALSDNGLFIGKSFLWSSNETIKTPEIIIKEYADSAYIHPYTFINHQLGLYCLDKEQYFIDFQKMYQSLCSLFERGIIDQHLLSFFENVGWNTEMNFKFFAPSQEYFVNQVNKVLSFVEFVHTEDIYSNVFPIYVIQKKKMEVKL